MIDDQETTQIPVTDSTQTDVSAPQEVAAPSSAAVDNYLLYFYGTECTHCHEMDEPLERLQKEEGLIVQKLECWHDEQNARLLEQYDQGLCGGVPFLYNTKTGKFICGTCDYETLKNWAQGV